jgi:hypothetical protein
MPAVTNRRNRLPFASKRLALSLGTVRAFHGPVVANIEVGAKAILAAILEFRIQTLGTNEKGQPPPSDAPGKKLPRGSTPCPCCA